MSGTERPGPPLAAVIGWPIRHSRSPRIHGHWLARYGLPGHYVPVAIAPDRVEAGLAALAELGFAGCNVTIPHKEAALALAARRTPTAEAIGAANTLTFLPGGGFEADNTDAHGFITSLRAGAPGWHGPAGPALVLGAGGAARAILAGLLAADVPEIRLTNRTEARARELADHFGPRVRVVPWAGASEAAAGAALVVNTTALGMSGQAPLDVTLAAAPATAVVTDIVYQPLETPLLAEARARGLTAVDGFGMLLHQAAPGFERWFGRRPEVDAELRAAALA